MKTLTLTFLIMFLSGYLSGCTSRNEIRSLFHTVECENGKKSTVKIDISEDRMHLTGP